MRTKEQYEAELDGEKPGLVIIYELFDNPLAEQARVPSYMALDAGKVLANMAAKAVVDGKIVVECCNDDMLITGMRVAIKEGAAKGDNVKFIFVRHEDDKLDNCSWSFIDDDARFDTLPHDCYRYFSSMLMRLM